jgi:hypothetical protein
MKLVGSIAIAAALGLSACGGSHGKMRVDSPVLGEYQKPDISAITGVPEPEPGDEEASGSASAKK